MASTSSLVFLRIAFFGKTGSGKSSSGNTFVGTQVFPVGFSAASITKHCAKQVVEMSGRQITLVDTPGLFDTSLTQVQVEQELKRCLCLTSPGPHVFVIVMQLGSRYTREERSVAERIQDIFGEESVKHTLLLFTHGDKLEGTIEEYLGDAEEDLKDLVHTYGNRYHVINNKDPSNREQVLMLLTKIEDIVHDNGGSCYTSEVYADVERRIQKKEQQLIEFYEQEASDKERELRLSYEEKLIILERKLQDTEDKLQMQEKMQELRKELTQALNEVVGRFSLIKSNCRKEAENSDIKEIF